jgi:hypothetical protein
MHWPHLPDARTDADLAFTDAAAAKAWLASLPTEKPAEALSALLRQVEAIDVAGLPAPRTVALLNLLRAAAVPRLTELEPCFARKPLPMMEDEASSFSVAVQFWMRLGMTYLRPVQHCTPANRCLPLLRAAGAFRLAQRVHYLAGRSCPALFDQLLIAALSAAIANDVAHKAMADPDFPRHGSGTIAGQVAWAFLLRAIDPYHLTAIEFPVAERAFGRWRELAVFRNDRPVATGEVSVIDLAAVTGGSVPESFPRWLDILGVTHKIARRIELLEDGEPPGSLKLGRELSAVAVIRLLADLDLHLRRRECLRDTDRRGSQRSLQPRPDRPCRELSATGDLRLDQEGDERDRRTVGAEGRPRGARASGWRRSRVGALPGRCGDRRHIAAWHRQEPALRSRRRADDATGMVRNGRGR